MVRNLNTKIALILAFIILAVYVLYTKEITLGLDLSGGSSLRYELPQPKDSTKPIEEIVDETIAVFRKRIDSIGLKSIPIRKQGDKEILIDLPGMAKSEVENIIKIIQSQGNLEWLLVAEDEQDKDAPDEIAVSLEEEGSKLVEFLKKTETEKGGWNLETDLTPLDLSMEINGREAHFRWFPTDENTLIKSGRQIPGAGTTFDTIRAGTASTDVQIASIYFTLIKMYKDPAWRFSGKDILSVQPSYDRSRMPAVGFDLVPERANDFGEFTREHIKKQLAIVLDGKVATDPVIQAELPGSGIISGPPPKGFLPQEQKQLLTVLRSGSISVKPILRSRHDIGPTLGESSIQRGETAILIGLAAVFLFIIVYYFLAGLVASLSLAINLTLLMGILVFLEATLTLPGIAGIVLTVGMAVDANILIFERIREEKDKGKTIAQSVKNGFEKAFLTIVDANATTFITGFILYQFGTGPIKGFAVTLMIGILTSLFSALVITKVIFALMLEKGLKKINMLRFLRKPDIDFIGMRTRMAVLSIALIVIGLGLFISEDESKYGLDFTGGYNVQIVCREGTTQGDVQSALSTQYPNVQVITVKQDVETEKDAETGPQVFNVKIKSTKANPASDLPPQDNAAMTDPVEENPVLETEPLEEENSETETISDIYEEKIKELLGDLMIEDPVSDLRLTPTEVETTGIQVTLHFVDPPITQEQLGNLGGEDPAAVYQQNVADAIGDFMECKAYIFSQEGRRLDLTAEYKRLTNVTPQWIKAGLLMKFKEARDGGSPVNIADPVPMTDYIGPTVGVELRDKTIIAIFFALVAIIIYIRLRFKEYKFGFAACIALVHDVLITLGAVAATRLTGLVDIEIDLPIIAAFMTIIGYSLNDTIVVFDRIRENLPRVNRPYNEVINMSINQTLSRTILTSLTTLLTVTILFAINYGQRNVLEGFSFALIVGIIVGTYSSMFVASPALLWLHNREAKANP